MEKKFIELMHTDETFQSKLKDALSSYTGEQTPEAVFNNVLSPLAKEYGISISFEEYIKSISELSDDELDQVAGGAGRTSTCKLIGNSLEDNCPCGIPIYSSQCTSIGDVTYKEVW